VTASARPRLEPRPSESWGDDVRAALGGAFPPAVVESFFATDTDSPPVPNVLGTLMHHPALAGPFLAYNQVLLQSRTLDARLRELIVLRVAWRTRSRYEWVQHVRLAIRVGITVAEIEAISGAEGTDSAAWAPVEQDVLAATDQLVDHYRIDDDTWARLARHFDAAQLIEIVFVAGTYTGLAMAFNSFGLQLDPELEALATTVPVIEE
jgi:alkylhydroperoxidase family enzyme